MIKSKDFFSEDIYKLLVDDVKIRHSIAHYVCEGTACNCLVMMWYESALMLGIVIKVYIYVMRLFVGFKTITVIRYYKY